MALTIYAVPVPPANQGRVTRNIEYDTSRSTRATTMINMRASAVHVHIRSAGFCLFNLGRGGTKHAASARLMAWASMAPLCSHHSFIHSSTRSLQSCVLHEVLLLTWHMTQCRICKMLCRKGAHLQDANKLHWCLRPCSQQFWGDFRQCGAKQVCSSILTAEH